MSKRANKKDIAVIGTGRFGTAVVEQLVSMNRYVLAIDSNEKNITEVSRMANSVAILDGADVEGLKGLGLEKFDTVIIGISNNIEIVAALLEIGVKHIIAKAKTIRHERVLRQIGVDIIVRPEAEAGIRTAIIATNSSFIKYSEGLQEVGDGYAIGTTIVKNASWFNRELKDMKFVNMGVSVVSLNRNSKVILPQGNLIMRENDKITVIGKIQNITKIFEEANGYESTSEVKINKYTETKKKSEANKIAVKRVAKKAPTKKVATKKKTKK